MAMDTRAAAALVLAEVLGGKSLNQVLPVMLDKVSPRDRGLLQQLSYGSLRQAPRLQAILSQMLEKPLRDKDRDIQGLLLCGLYQLEDTRIPDHAAVSATVAATRPLKKAWARGMTNAVLRRFLRERDELTSNLQEPAASAHPDWLYHELQQQWPEQYQEVLSANNQQPPMTMRVNSERTTRDDYLAQLEQAGIAATPGEISPHAVYLATPRDVTEIPGFAEGMVSVQDEAAQLAALLLDTQAGDRVLDACAAPGGKSCHILETQPGLAELVAMDIDAQRLLRVADNLDRLELSAELVVGDAENPPAQLEPGSFDRILVDAPCSASGVIRRHPDVKLLRRQDDIGQLGQQQRKILAGLWPLLRPGGHLLYATCSVLDGENSEIVRQFTGEHADARLINPTVNWGEATDCGRQLLPSTGGPDGLFYALLQKSA